MGNCNTYEEQSSSISEPSECNYKREDFHFIKPIGKGGFGKVWLVQRKFDGAYFAVKEMLKARILSKKSIYSVINERKILA